MSSPEQDNVTTCPLCGRPAKMVMGADGGWYFDPVPVKEEQMCNLLPTPVIVTRALQSVVNERVAQDKKWGEQNHDPLKWLAILLEEVGEFSKVVLEQDESPALSYPTLLRKEAVQVAAVALAIVECCDRNNWVRGEEEDA